MTLQSQLEIIKSFNNAEIISCDPFSWGGWMITFSSTKFSASGISRELGVRIEESIYNEFYFVSMAKNEA